MCYHIRNAVLEILQPPYPQFFPPLHGWDMIVQDLPRNDLSRICENVTGVIVGR